MHLRWLMTPPPSTSFSVCIARFNSSVSYGGLQYANSTEGIFFSENKDKSIQSALTALVLVEDDSEAQVSFISFVSFIKIDQIINCFF